MQMRACEADVPGGEAGVRGAPAAGLDAVRNLMWHGLPDILCTVMCQGGGWTSLRPTPQHPVHTVCVRAAYTRTPHAHNVPQALDIAVERSPGDVVLRLAFCLRPVQ